MRARKVNPSIEIYATSGLDKAEYVQCEPEIFAASILALLKSADLDGFDMDWEVSVRKPIMDRLLCALHARLHSHRPPLRVSAAVTPTAWRYDLGALSKCCDDVNVMACGREWTRETLPESLAEWSG